MCAMVQTSTLPAAEASDPIGGTKERILSVAERLFAELGLAGVSLRMLTSTAGVNLAAVHYHFGSKEALLEAIFLRRAEPIAARRLELLARCVDGPDRPPLLEQIIEAFLVPGLEASGDTDADGTTFMRLRARLICESGALARRLLRQGFDESSRCFLDALHHATSDLPFEDLHWRFHFLLGTLVYTMANPGRIQALTKGRCDPGDIGRALRHLVPFLAAGFRAPALSHSGTRPRHREDKVNSTRNPGGRKWRERKGRHAS